ncbi:hypothetical protein HPB48_014575 [Haemaphysalis longicornis]|uniref:Uncharacterized protein n=1 Tax=Haemaphysalis longicornis TaxID=44386 RepID=A0A9J6GAH1_HAELO|nr:hypothetical protein HPB48_014575 [Haemaphysalis longicornis]
MARSASRELEVDFRPRAELNYLGPPRTQVYAAKDIPVTACPRQFYWANTVQIHNLERFLRPRQGGYWDKAR